MSDPRANPRPPMKLVANAVPWSCWTTPGIGWRKNAPREPWVPRLHFF